MNRYITATAGAVLVGVLALAGCGSGRSALLPATSPSAHHSATASPSPVVSSYPDVESLVAAMAVGGAVCKDVQFLNGSTAGGAVNPFVECTGTSQGDTAIIVFDNHADALQYAAHMLNVNTQIGTPGAVVVGPDWAVNTSYGFAAKVVRAVGGEEEKNT
jgi:hypothetical protein